MITAVTVGCIWGGNGTAEACYLRSGSSSGSCINTLRKILGCRL
jgi:hypothetical protein